MWRARATRGSSPIALPFPMISLSEDLSQPGVNLHVLVYVFVVRNLLLQDLPSPSFRSRLWNDDGTKSSGKSMAVGKPRVADLALTGGHLRISPQSGNVTRKPVTSRTVSCIINNQSTI
jgi:hypothetical protein